MCLQKLLITVQLYVVPFFCSMLAMLEARASLRRLWSSGKPEEIAKKFNSSTWRRTSRCQSSTTKTVRMRRCTFLKSWRCASSIGWPSLVPGGLWHTTLINKNLVDFFVPFLPLEFRHVVQCAMAEMEARGLEPDPNVANTVADDLVYFPKSERLFAAKGCKTIESKLNYYIEDSHSPSSTWPPVVYGFFLNSTFMLEHGESQRHFLGAF